MNRDIKKITTIISDEIPMHARILQRIVTYIVQERNQAIGATYAEMCALHNNGHDILSHPASSVAKSVLRALDRPLAKGE